MIKRVTLKNFKKFSDSQFSFHPSGVTYLAGGNNSGKSTILQALAV
jgi:AAA15 family ATPase/GTPase